MRPELGFEASSARRLVVGTIVTLVGAAAFVIGLFLQPGGTIGLIAFAAGGGLLLFLGVTSVSSTVARPVTKVIGWPVAKLFGTTGVLARENAGRAPRRTSATAAALMIGVALVDRVRRVRGVAPFDVHRNARAQREGRLRHHGPVLPGPPAGRRRDPSTVKELSAVTAVRGTAALVDGKQKAIGAVDPLAFEQLVNIGVTSGSYEGSTAAASSSTRTRPTTST